MVTPFITDSGEDVELTSQQTGEVIRLPRYGYWQDLGRGKPEVKEISDDVEYLKKKYNVPDNHVFAMKDLREVLKEVSASEMTPNIVIDTETPHGYRSVFPLYLSPDFNKAIIRVKTQLPHVYKLVVQFVNPEDGETVKGPKYDTTTQNVRGPDVEKVLPSGIKQQKPFEPTQYEPRDRFQENRTMNELNKFRNIIGECLREVAIEKNPKLKLKESLRSVVKEVLKEITEMKPMSNFPAPQPTDEEKDKVRKGYNKDGNVRLDKTNEKQLKELETIVHGIDPTWEVYWDDNRQLIVRAQNLLYVRITQRFENSYDIDAMVKLVDRIRAIAQTWDQVKAFVKANFGSLKKGTNADQLKDRAMALRDPNKEVIKKAAGPMGDAIKNRGEKDNGEDAKLGTTKRDDKDYKEDDVKRDEDQPDQQMKQVTDPGKDPDSKNKNIEKTTKVKPPRHDKSPTELRPKDKATPKFRKKQVKV